MAPDGERIPRHKEICMSAKNIIAGKDHENPNNFYNQNPNNKERKYKVFISMHLKVLPHLDLILPIPSIYLHKKRSRERCTKPDLSTLLV